MRDAMLVVDPFNGSGRSMVAASRLGVQGIGIDLDPADCRAAQERFLVERRPDVVLPMVAAELVAINSVVQGDCRDVIPQIPDNSVALGLVSPPYARQRLADSESVTMAGWVIDNQTGRMS
jgi:DNA modification methylase